MQETPVLFSLFWSMSRDCFRGKIGNIGNPKIFHETVKKEAVTVKKEAATRKNKKGKLYKLDTQKSAHARTQGMTFIS